MLAQYQEIKAQYPNYVLFFRLGDFFEMFYKDAEDISKELDLALTSRAGVHMCGVPHHSAVSYIKRLIDNGRRVAICEQVEDPSVAKGLVRREVVRIITPGTVIEDGMLDESKNNYILCLYYAEKSCGMVFADVSTGEIHLIQKSAKNVAELSKGIIGEIGSYMPSEILFNDKFLDLDQVHFFITEKVSRCVADVLPDESFSPDNAENLTEQFVTESSGSIPDDMELCKKAAYALFGYINTNYKSEVSRSVKFIVHGGSEYMELNFSARRNLELIETMRSREHRGSLLWVLDKTKTSLGKRRLKQVVSQPLMKQIKIMERLDAVEELASDIAGLEGLRESLDGITDLERLMSRIAYKMASPKDVYSLGRACGKLPKVKESLSLFGCSLLKSLNCKISSHDDITALVENALADDQPLSTKDGGYIKTGFNGELDRLRSIMDGGGELLKKIEEREKEATGIKTLKVGFNRVFGYYIEVSKGQVDQVPDRYVRKQTLTTGERYITQELKEIEREMLTAGERIIKLEAQIFAEVRKFISERMESVLKTAEGISDTDVLASFARAAIENNYTKPDITLDSVIDIKGGRHPVVEKILSDIPFTPNDAYLDLKKNRLIMITGPNMSGKSTFMRQVALITLMAQIGCFVPAKHARIGVVDKIFTRVGASDDLTSGKSTFMVEMDEVAEILTQATSHSLVIMDEIGRGTSTFDGISIAKAVAEYINGKNIGCRTLFATHYHELISLEKSNEGIRNFSVAVVKKGDDIKFLHKIVEGGTDDSYGIEVAKLAGIPKKVIEAAKTALEGMEAENKIDLENRLKKEREGEIQMDFSEINKDKVIQRLKNLDMDDLTPREAWQVLEELKTLV
ncbi:MAG: DNA mismatch repair protein MutS [Ruminiclostridium sp.]|jgi:DNA mismatch repair protein MutS|nr:DNA mismatch repair protein MutS [Ruminiclostridium sp.]